jgi:hypothetical protein
MRTFLTSNTSTSLQTKLERKRSIWCWRMPSSGMLRRATLVRTNVSEERIVYIIRETRIGELGTTLALTSNRSTLRRYTIIYCHVLRVGSVTDNSTRIGYHIYSLWRVQLQTGYNYNEHCSTGSFSLRGLSSRTDRFWFRRLTNSLWFQRLTDQE